MLNLRQINETEQLNEESNAFRSSKFSAPNFLGNIGEPLNHYQSERYIFEDEDTNSVEETSLTESGGYSNEIMERHLVDA